mmetsp:Transcript_47887/g.133034  ORF Transcript_47887/g.133034 Transcript_47887/m.133034 type:complete len:211 (-) Transcript_47887:46-678(-)
MRTASRASISSFFRAATSACNVLVLPSARSSAELSGETGAATAIAVSGPMRAGTTGLKIPLLRHDLVAAATRARILRALLAPATTAAAKDAARVAGRASALSPLRLLLPPSSHRRRVCACSVPRGRGSGAGISAAASASAAAAAIAAASAATAVRGLRTRNGPNGSSNAGCPHAANKPKASNAAGPLPRGLVLAATIARVPAEDRACAQG